MAQTVNHKGSNPASTPLGADVDDLANSLDCLSLRQFCRLGGITETTAEAWRKRGTGPAHVRLGNTVLYPRKCVSEFLLQNVRERRQVEPKGLL